MTEKRKETSITSSFLLFSSITSHKVYIFVFVLQNSLIYSLVELYSWSILGKGISVTTTLNILSTITQFTLLILAQCSLLKCRKLAVGSPSSAAGAHNSNHRHYSSVRRLLIKSKLVLKFELQLEMVSIFFSFPLQVCPPEFLLYI